MGKNQVTYNRDVDYRITVGSGAIVVPIDHPSDLVSNTKPVMTSKVISYDKKTGVFETLNSVYTPRSK